MKTKIISSFIIGSLLSFAITANALELGADLMINASSSDDAIVDVDVDVGSSADLNVYAQSIESNDSSVTEVDVEDKNEVSVEYGRPAKLFGFINVYITEEARVKTNSDGDATAKVTKSWWSIFARTETKSEEFRSAIQSRIQNISADGSAELSASAKVRYLAEINAAAEAVY